MKDFRIVQAKTILSVTAVSPLRGFSPPAVVVLGEKLDRTQEVLYNDIAVDEFIISSPGRLIVKIPSSQIGKALRSIQALSTTTLSDQSARITTEFLNPPRKIEGLDRLVQSWIMLFFTTPGSDVFSPSSGGGVQTLIGKNASGDRSGPNLTADLMLAVERTKSELLRLQSQDSRIPPSERLLSCALSSVKFDPQTTELSAIVTLQNMLGQSADLTVR